MTPKTEPTTDFLPNTMKDCTNWAKLSGENFDNATCRKKERALAFSKSGNLKSALD